ncbi:uncharacterized protein K452DRAFT_131959 [Aplosporella prunicola CBS 121167]|uniref:Uncharacterized protein n=1 Tax=Aplosporella prunicola CBS 121167 TaxID=1176127 RepID=A0A6A6BQ21_9PEZI|nr:uncharacterized protein K452DRAFT_131959 [Aplosporella prunicola CBS 121167]KAF2144907.1 hypothetical protein K452DRAFT_131959 [Aplosporella prunicola CBS 121167]
MRRPERRRIGFIIKARLPSSANDTRRTDQTRQLFVAQRPPRVASSANATYTTSASSTLQPISLLSTDHQKPLLSSPSSTSLNQIIFLLAHISPLSHISMQLFLLDETRETPHAAWALKKSIKPQCIKFGPQMVWCSNGHAVRLLEPLSQNADKSRETQ